MSRARDMANLGAQAGSGLDASDITTGTFSTSVIPNLAGDKITSGTLSNTVQDNITRLGTVTTGTMNNTIGSSATFPAGTVVGHTAIQRASSQITKSGSPTELDSNLRLTYTAKSSSNKLLFQVYAWFCSPNSAHLSWSYVYEITDGIVNQPPASGSRSRVHWAKRVDNHDPNDFNTMNYMVYADASSGAKTYTIYYGTEGKSDQFYVSTLYTSSGVSAPITFSITEIQQ